MMARQTVMKLHDTSNEATVNKFTIFCASNTEMPFTVKKQVFDAAMSGALLYSTETWFTNNPKRLQAQYNKSVRSLLGVRPNTSSDLCLLESGIHPVEDIIMMRRYKFLKTKLSVDNYEEPFTKIYELCGQVNTPGYRFLTRTLQHDPNNDPLSKIASRVTMKQDSTKFVVYKTILNPSLSVHQVYKSNECIPDYKRQAFTRLRVMSHSLQVEKGRWSRTPPDLRLCTCENNVVQTEKHVLLSCPISRILRQKYVMLNFTNMKELMDCGDKVKNLCSFIHDVLNMYN